MEAPICRICKVFFGCQEGLCSKCFRDSQKPLPSPQAVSSSQDKQKSSTFPEEEKKEPRIPANPGKCFQCSKLLGPVNFKCKCENFYCARHRYPEDHRCSFDHKSDGIRKLSEENPLVEAAKFNKIV